jgi:hypothetical protein
MSSILIITNKPDGRKRQNQSDAATVASHERKF